ncbi:Serine hydroxymethyltransferase [Hibiscus syriacus]|uniref:Serine hydroxymethyltransferase n=1 Tax=Hibiscus syriacus TaxID=106335 RepID=A0A6A2XJV2_HIBSY|nr:Serine hydroxymethyltransferase [Hibiscus syriacus]
MQACGGAAMMGYLQQPMRVNKPAFPLKVSNITGFWRQIKLNSVKPCRAQLEGSLVTGRSSSSPSVPVLENRFVDHGLSEADPELCSIISKEKERQFKSLELIASENFTSRAVMEAVGSCLTNKYSEGLPGKRYYGGLVDYDMLEKTATLFRPKLIIAGASAHPRDFDYPRMRKLVTYGVDIYWKIADAVGAFLMMDMAHISGLVAASVVADPFEYCDIVTTTTHKSLRGPRGGMIFFKKDNVHGVDLESAINNAVFPGLQGCLHNHTIGGLAVCLKHAQSSEFKGYQNQVVSNCRALANRLVELGYTLVSGGSDNHLVLVDLRPLVRVDGARVEKILDMAFITLNKNSVPGDKSALVPGGIRIGSPAMTTRGFKEKKFIAIADFIHEGVQITIDAKGLVSRSSKLQEFLKFVVAPEFPLTDKVSNLRSRVEELTTRFPIPGV